MGLPPIGRDLGLPSNNAVPGLRRGFAVDGIAELDRVDHVGDSRDERGSGGNSQHHEHHAEDEDSDEPSLFDELA